jgi:hypothetical protein
MARTVCDAPGAARSGFEDKPLTCIFTVERVTGTEPALSAWESAPSGPATWPDLRVAVSASDRERPLFTGFNGPLMARRTTVRPALVAVPWSFASSPVPNQVPDTAACRICQGGKITPRG